MTPHPPPHEGDDLRLVDINTYTYVHRTELSRLRAIEKAARACDRIYSGSFQGLPLFCNFIDGDPVDAAPLFDALRRALETRP